MTGLTKRFFIGSSAEDGFVLGLVMVSFVVFTIIGLAFVKMGGFERRNVYNYYHKTRAFYFSEGGIHKGLWRLNNISKASATFADANVSVSYDSVGLLMIATGSSGNMSDSLRVTVVDNGVFEISAWEEL